MHVMLSFLLGCATTIVGILLYETLTANYDEDEPVTNVDTYYVTSAAGGVIITATLEEKGGLVRVGGSDYVKARHSSQRRQLLYRLMGRAVLA